MAENNSLGSHDAIHHKKQMSGTEFVIFNNMSDIFDFKLIAEIFLVVLELLCLDSSSMSVIVRIYVFPTLGIVLCN